MCAASRIEPLENSTPQWSLCEHEHAKGKRHLSIIIKTVLTALVPCKDLRNTRPCFENDLTYGQVQKKKKKIRETSYLNFKTEKHHQAPKPASREIKNSHPILKMKQQKDAVLSFCGGYREKLQHDRSRGQTCHHTQHRLLSVSSRMRPLAVQLERTQGQLIMETRTECCRLLRAA